MNVKTWHEWRTECGGRLVLDCGHESGAVLLATSANGEDETVVELGRDDLLRLLRAAAESLAHDLQLAEEMAK